MAQLLAYGDLVELEEVADKVVGVLCLDVERVQGSRREVAEVLRHHDAPAALNRYGDHVRVVHIQQDVCGCRL
ncbi:hypothetical protein [Belnapia rosea]|uniref:hypothetical protein n=1 Tax=Belnapia rosea TaxID=938405 RepID=UPI000B831D22|nr:hypothetical protein [Belnapia rosea]